MRALPTFSHRGADDLIDLVCQREHNQLVRELRRTHFSVRASGKVQRNRYVCPIDQRATNRAVLQVLESSTSWTKGKTHRLGRKGSEVSIRPDFELARAGVYVEVEFGNAASMHRDFVKFECLAGGGRLHVAILVVPSRRVAKMMDPSVGHAAKALNLIELLVPTYPLQVIEVDLDSADERAIERAYERVRRRYRGTGNLIPWPQALAY